MQGKTRKNNSNWRSTPFSIKILCFSLISITIFSVSFNFHQHFNIIIPKNTEINQLNEIINNLTYLCSEKGVFDLQKKIEILEIRLENSNQTIVLLQDVKRRLEAEKAVLEKKLRLFMVIVSGSVNTSGWMTSPVSITFDNGIKHTVPVVNGTYNITLQNNQTYQVIVHWRGVGAPLNEGDADAGTFPLYANQKNYKKDWYNV